MPLPSLHSNVPDIVYGDRALSLLIIGNRGGTNVGGSFERGAISLGVPVDVLESRNAMGGPGWLRSMKWHLLQHTPAQLAQFSSAVVAHCAERAPTVLLSTGLAPLNEMALEKIGAMGICRCNYLTDDAWNSSQRSPWFFRALAQYDHIFTPRRANLSDLRSVSRANVSYVPFAYDPELFYRVSLDAQQKEAFVSDVMFAGGADADRVAYIRALSAAGVRVGLYGSYWERFPDTRALTRGQASIDILRKAIAVQHCPVPGTPRQPGRPLHANLRDSSYRRMHAG